MEVDSDSDSDSDSSQSHHFSLSRLNRNDGPYDPDGRDFPKPSKITAAAEMDDDTITTTMEVIDGWVERQDNYPETIQLLMNKGLLKRRQNCRKCGKAMTLRRRKNAYEWRCRTRNMKDCSTSSMKMGSWFEFSKHSFKIMLNFLIMHAKNCCIAHIAEQLNFSHHSVSEICRYALELMKRIESKYPKVGKDGAEVIVEIVTLKTKKTIEEQYHVFAGQELKEGSSRCFAVLLPDLEDETIENIKSRKIEPGANVRTVKTTMDDFSVHHDDEDVEYFEEADHYERHHRLFTNLRRDQPDYIYANKCVSAWVKEQVVRKTEGPGTLERLFEQLMAFTS